LAFGSGEDDLTPATAAKGRATWRGEWMDRLTALLFWLFAAVIGLVMVALYLGWWPFGISSTF